MVIGKWKLPSVGAFTSRSSDNAAVQSERKVERWKETSRGEGGENQ